MISEATGVFVEEDNRVRLFTEPLPQIEENQVLIKVHSGPINPSDTLYLQGVYPSRKPKPTFAGFEGSGLVVQTGSSEKAKSLLNQRVAFFALTPKSGTWANFAVVKIVDVYPIPAALSYEEAACSLVNPLTVQGFIHTCKLEGHKVIVHSAAASALGKMLLTACKQNSIELIALVRKEEQVLALKELGAEHVLNTTSATFKQDLASTFDSLKPSAFFDAVTGADGTLVFNLMPHGSTTYCYGLLSPDAYQVGAGDLIFKNKTLKGWWLSLHMTDASFTGPVVAAAFENLATRAYKTHIAKTFTYEQFEEALAFYSANMSAGKVLFQNADF